MKYHILILFASSFFCLSQSPSGLELPPYMTKETSKKRDVFSKKLYWGLVFDSSWSSVTNNSSYFYKPSLGWGLRLDYYILKNFGVGIGAYYHQRGTGIKLSKDEITGNEEYDPTYLSRIRFHSAEMPITLLFRSNPLFGSGKGPRLFVSGALNPQYNFKAEHVVISPGDGNHKLTDMSSSYYTFGLSLDGSIGALIRVGDASMFLCDFIFQFGTTNVYKNTTNYGANRLAGIRIAYMF